MMNIPYKLDVKAMAELFKKRGFAKSLPLLINVFRYLKDGVVCVSDLIKIGRLVRFQSKEVSLFCLNIDTEFELFEFSRFVSTLYKFGFVDDLLIIKRAAHLRLQKIYEKNA